MNNQINLDKIQNRVLGIDLNPNYVGWSIVDWKSESEFKVIKSGVYSIKDLNDKDFSLKGKGLNSSSKERIYISNKRIEIKTQANLFFSRKKPKKEYNFLYQTTSSSIMSIALINSIADRNRLDGSFSVAFLIISLNCLSSISFNGILSFNC